MPRKRKEEGTIEPGNGSNRDPELIKQLVPGTLDRVTCQRAARGPQEGNLRARAGRRTTHDLRYDTGDAKPVDRTNHRNGTSCKSIATDDDLLDVEIPRDREGTSRLCAGCPRPKPVSQIHP